MTDNLRVIRGIHARAVVEEATALHTLALTLTESIHKLLQLRSTLDFEEDLVVVVRDLNIEVL